MKKPKLPTAKLWKKVKQATKLLPNHLLMPCCVFLVGLLMGMGGYALLTSATWLPAVSPSSQDKRAAVAQRPPSATKLPQVAAKSPDDHWLPVGQLVLRRPGFVVGYDGRNRGPAWVYERLTAENLQGHEERGSFYEDQEIPATIRASLNDYKRTGYDRGHMAPAADHKASQEEMQATFALSNMIPQTPSCNRGPWKKLEEYARELTKKYPIVHVISGTAYLPRDGENGRYVFYPVIGGSDAGVPTHIWKVIRAERRDGVVNEEAYLLPNDDSCKGKNLSDFKTTTDKIEHLAGLLLRR